MATDVALSPAEAEPRAAEPDGLYEIVDGRVVEKVMGAHEVELANWLHDLFTEFAMPRRLGRSHVETLFLIDRERGLKRRPDVAFLSHRRWPFGHRVPYLDAWDVVPDLMVEVVSPSNSASEVMRKVEEYRRAGARLIWVVYPAQEAVQVYEPAGASRGLGRDEALDGGDVIPGFRLPVVRLFDDEPETTAPPA